jgi:hypothetical protein
MPVWVGSETMNTGKNDIYTFIESYGRMESEPTMKIRCPVCGGSGGVEPSFGTGCVYYPGQGITSTISAKPCPACGGTGIQDDAA